MPPHLIIAATVGELDPLRAVLEDSRYYPLRLGGAVNGCLHRVPVVLAWLGVGKVNTAAGLALAAREIEPTLVVQLGIGGAFPGSRLETGEVAVASNEVHLDSGVRSVDGFSDMEALGFPLLSSPELLYNRIPVDERLSSELAADGHPRVPFGTAEAVTGDARLADELSRRHGVAVESMEGAAAAQVSLALGLPFAEVRGVSNPVGERDKANWRIAEAVTRSCAVVEAWARRGAPSGRQ